MHSHVTVGLDGSLESLAAADWAAGEALRRQLPLRLVHVWDPQPDASSVLVGAETLRHWAERIPREAATELKLKYPAVDIKAVQVAGRPAAILAAEADRSELLVIGSRALGRLAGFFVGSVSLGVLAQAERPVVVVRAGEGPAEPAPAEPREPTGVVLGLDLDRPSGELIEFAFTAAERRSAPLLVVHSWTLPALYGVDPAIVPSLQSDIAVNNGKALSEALEPWRQEYPSVIVTPHSTVGRPAHNLVEAARGADLIVVGRRIRRHALGTHIGSVTHAVLHHATAPVAVVPHD